MNPADFAILPAESANTMASVEAELSIKLGVTLANSHDGHTARYLLQLDDTGHLLIRDTRSPDLKPFSVAFRPRYGARGGDPLLRALGPGVKEVIDATAGLGVDAFHLALSGLQVTALECHPVIHALLENGLNHCENASARSRLRFIHTDAIQWLSDMQGAVETIYLDPMYPPRPGSASPKKGIQLLQNIVSQDPERDRALLAIAMERASRRVVVKRPHHAEPILPGKSGDTRGKLVRFDIYPPAR